MHHRITLWWSSGDMFYYYLHPCRRAAHSQAAWRCTLTLSVKLCARLLWNSAQLQRLWWTAPQLLYNGKWKVENGKLNCFQQRAYQWLTRCVCGKNIHKLRLHCLHKGREFGAQGREFGAQGREFGMQTPYPYKSWNQDKQRFFGKNDSQGREFREFEAINSFPAHFWKNQKK